MLSVYGLVLLPRDPQLKVVETQKGHILDFLVASCEKSYDGQDEWHQYRANLWIKKEDLATWQEKLQPGSVFKVRDAFWISKVREEGGWPIPVLKLVADGFQKLSTAQWYAKKPQEKK